MEEVVIMGGGIAGLSCMNALLDHHLSPILLEGATIGTPKMCGEFIAPEAVALLEQWDIGPIKKIQVARFFAKNSTFQLPFATPAGAMARSQAELQLAHYARKKGGDIREHALIQKITPATTTTPYILHLASGEIIQAKTVIFATGKYGQQSYSPPALPYFGIKMHLQQIVMPDTLLMYSLHNAYIGIVPISNTVSNCAWLLKKECVDKFGSCKAFFYHVMESNPSLQRIFDNVNLLDQAWFESPAPAFQRRILPPWPNAFWIGDALAGLHPAIGSGFSHGIQSAIMAAEYYLQHNTEAYLKIATQWLKPKLRLGKLLHHILLNPIFSSAALPFLQHNPLLLNACLKRLGYA